MEDNFISYEQAMKIEKLGFDKECLAWWNYNTLCFFNEDLLLDNYAGETGRPYAPLYQQVFDWALEKHDLYCYITPIGDFNSWTFEILCKDIMGGIFSLTNKELNELDTYEKAKFECINKLIKFLEDK